jgi:hypothetical protein
LITYRGRSPFSSPQLAGLFWGPPSVLCNEERSYFPWRKTAGALN